MPKTRGASQNRLQGRMVCLPAHLPCDMRLCAIPAGKLMSAKLAVAADDSTLRWVAASLKTLNVQAGCLQLPQSTCLLAPIR